MAYSAVQKYKEQSIRSMTSGELLILLLDESIKNLNVSIMMLDNGDIDNFENCLKKSKDIFFYLSNICDTKYDISQDLQSLYGFINSQIMTAEVKKDKKCIEEILPLVKDMRDTWKEANTITSKPNT